MKVLYDYQTFFQQVGGVSRCFCELAKHMPDDVTCIFSVCESDNEYLRDKTLMPGLPHCRLTAQKFLYPLKFYGRTRLYNYLQRHFPSFPTFENVNKPYSIKVLKGGDYDVFHATLYDDYFLPYLNGKPFVITVHDMIWELYPDKGNRLWSQQKHKLCLKANHVIAISEQTKKDLMTLWQIPENKISVVYHGAPEHVEYNYGSPIVAEPYFLYVGRRNGYKNFIQTIKDFAEFHSKYPDVNLICTGGRFTDVEKRLIDGLNLSGCVSALFVSDKDLFNLYHYAIAFIFPSIYEGFGIPILEAFSSGCLVLLNDSSCFPEIGGTAAVYFKSSTDGQSNLPQKLVEVYNMNKQNRNMYIQRGYERVKLFNWSMSAKKLVDIYKNVQKQNKFP